MRRSLWLRPVAAVMLLLFALTGLAIPAFAASGPVSDDPWKHTDWPRVFVTVFSPPLAIIIITALKMRGVFDPRCPECRGKLHVYEKCITPATNEGPGEMARTRHCDNCFYHSETRYKVMGLGDKPSKWDFWFRND